ncbi:MAG: gliding motility-associated C-terminal domain-containing protein [Saprospiraceae bacterium]|nr:gliding motility-associated C-terminal domain-containing protein [Saprospiraceae bacterium]MBP9210266.1 gliding motility-associated C-terminal domain-containing protein [Saprospiraceae bacterium]
MGRFLLVLYIIAWLPASGSGQGCAGLNADAGPDQFSCDPTSPPQLQGSYSGVPDKYYWTPATYLSDPNSTDPTVNAPAGKYTFTFTVEAMSSINLISNGNFEAGNSGFTHEYSYGFPGGTFGPGWLSVGTNPLGYNGSWAPCGDHTSGSGNQLIVDGHTSANAKVWCQTVSVSPGKTYLFRFYVQSVFPAAPCQLNVLANNTSFGSVQGGALCDWQTFEECFKANSATVEICIRETSGVGYGNDFAIDDIEMYEKCMDTDEVVVEIVDLKAQVAIPQPPRCASDVFDLNALGSSTGPNIRYEWRSDGGTIVSSSGPTAKGKGRGTYYVKVIYQNGNVYCEKEAEIEADPSDDLEGLLEVEGIANCNSDTIELRGSVINGSGDFSYHWIPANKIHRGQNEPTAYVTEAGLYKLVVIDKQSGCEIQLQEVVASDTTKPKVDISADSLISCANPLATLTGTPFDTSRYLYEWTIPDLTLVRNADTLHAADTGIYLLRATDKFNKCYTERSHVLRADTTAPLVDLGPDGTIDCRNEEFLIQAKDTGISGPSRYVWTLPAGPLPPDSVLQDQRVTQGGWVVLTAINRTNGCSHTDSLFIADVRKLPAAIAGPTDTLNCYRAQLQLDGSASTTDSTSLGWFTNTGSIIGDTTSPFPTVDRPGWYFLRVTDTTNQCRQIDSVYIHQDTTRPSAVLDAETTFRCADTLRWLDGSASSSGAAIRYTWFTTDGSIASGQGTPNISVKGPGRYLLVVNNLTNGCSDTAEMLVKPDLGAPLARIDAPDTITCNIRSVQLNATTSSPAGNPVRFEWKADSGQTIQNDHTLNPQVDGGGYYTLIATDTVNGCSTTVQAFVSVDTLAPKADAGADAIWNCASRDLLLDGANSQGTHALNFSWSSSGGQFSGRTDQPQASVRSPGSYQLTVRDVRTGCYAIDSIDVIADTVHPVARIALPDTINCKVRSLALVGSGSGSGAHLRYEWMSSNGQLTGNTNLPIATALRAGTYTLILVDTSNFCRDSASVIVVEDLRVPQFSITGNTMLNCSGKPVELSAAINSPRGGESFSWSTRGGMISGRTDSASIQGSRSGWYVVTVVDPRNECTSTDSVFVDQVNDLGVELLGGASLTCIIRKTTLSGRVLGGSGTENLVWTTRGGNIVGNATGMQIEADRPGWYFFSAQQPGSGCDATDSVEIKENTNVPTTVHTRLQQANCPGDLWAFEIDSVTGGERPLRFVWNGQDFQGGRISDGSFGNQQIEVFDRNGCSLSATFTTIAPVGIDVQLTPLARIDQGSSLPLDPVYSLPPDSIAIVSWSPERFLSCADCLQPIAERISEDIEYFCTVISNKGCSATARIRIEVIRREVWVPNAFSPNGDQINDRFFPVLSPDAFREIRGFRIFDRWGNLQFEQKLISPGQMYDLAWDGTRNGEKLNPGVYLFTMELVWNNGDVQLLSGDISLIR